MGRFGLVRGRIIMTVGATSSWLSLEEETLSKYKRKGVRGHGVGYACGEQGAGNSCGEPGAPHITPLVQTLLLLAICYWLLTTGYLILATGYLLLATSY